MGCGAISGLFKALLHLGRIGRSDYVTLVMITSNPKTVKRHILTVTQRYKKRRLRLRFGLYKIVRLPNPLDFDDPAIVNSE